jgi:hypothetical protein
MTAKIFKQPCVKISLKNVVPFRQGNSRAGQIKSVLPTLQWSFDDRQLRTAYICQDFACSNGRQVPTLEVTCRRFVPGPHDVLVEPYEAPDGEIMIVESSPYACVGILSYLDWSLAIVR